MEPVSENSARKWVREEHLRNIKEGQWTDLYDADGNVLPGIRGKTGVFATKVDGTEIGVDLIEMSPGSAFPLHEHIGDHVLYIKSGSGIVHINDREQSVEEGDFVYIPAEYPHGVSTDSSSKEPLIIIAFGHPHNHVNARNRMLHPRKP